MTRDLSLGAVGAFFMMLGDLTLSLIPPCDTDEGLYLREAYMNGGYPAWKLTLLLVTGIVAVCGYYFGLRAMHDSLDERYPKTKRWFWRCSLLFCFTGLAIHFAVGAGAYLTSYTAVRAGKDAAVAFVGDYTKSIQPGLVLLYLPMGYIFLSHLFLLARGRTVYSRRMLLFHPLFWIALLAGIPDMRQMMSCRLVTLDYVMTQCSGNLAPLMWFLACLLLPDRFKYPSGGDRSYSSASPEDAVGPEAAVADLHAGRGRLPRRVLSRLSQKRASGALCGRGVL